MGYRITLENEDGSVATVDENHTEGGTYVIGGSNECSLSVTYNYSFFFYNFFDKEQGIRWIYGKKGKDVIDRMQDFIKVVGTRRDKNYWADTPGNAGHAVSVLLNWAKQHPEAVFNGD